MSAPVTPFSLASPPFLFSLEAELPLTGSLQQGLPASPGILELRRFPDGETYVRVDSCVRDRHCVILANFCQPDDKFLPLRFLADTLYREGAASVGLVAPYLSYMRQDQAFRPGEAITSRTFAALISGSVDWLVTVDPHLHRYHSLSEIYTIPACAVSGMPAMQRWLGSEPGELLLVGPDTESRQWVETLAQASGHPFIVGSKQRLGDRDVRVSLPAHPALARSTAVVVDDVIASGHTLLQSIAALREHGAAEIVCAAVHGVFAEQADRKILAAGAHRLATSNSIPGKHCAFDLAPLLIPEIQRLISTTAERPKNP